MSPQLQIPVPSVPGCSPIPGCWEEMEQEGPIGKDLEPSSRNPWRSQLVHVKPGFLSLPFNILDLKLNLPTSTSFLPFLSVCSVQMLLSSQKSPTSPDTLLLPSDAASIPAPKSLPTPALTYNSHAFSQKVCTSPSVLWLWPPPSIWILQDQLHRPPSSG